MSKREIQKPGEVTVVEVGPRDGLQNERIRLSTNQKLQLISGLADAGLKQIEVGSFVSPKWIPQMADTAEVLAGLEPSDQMAWWVLVPNTRGYEAAREAGAKHVAVFLSSSESHNRKNLNRSIDESLEGIREITQQARADGMTIRGYISTVFGCPYEGDVDFRRVLRIAHELFSLGVQQVSLGDTTGMGTPLQVKESLTEALRQFDTRTLALHLHDTRGLGVANAMVALECGITTFDSSIGGMGGCPYAPGASGNLGTEDLLYLLHTSGVQTGVDLSKILKLSRRLENELGATLNSAYYRYSRTSTRPIAHTS